MGCQMLALLDDDTPQAAPALAAVPGWFEAWEGHLSRFRDDSELSRLNRAAGLPTRVSPVMAAAIETALQATDESGGLVVPTLLPALEAAGYDRDFAELAQFGITVNAPEPAPDGHEFEWNPVTRTITLPPDVRLDFGGVAKGWAADQALARLAPLGPALVDAGGDIAAGAAPRGEAGWPVGVADPWRPGETLDLLIVAERGVATSGRDYRRWQRGGVWQHHILDPRTGHPADTDVLTATVIAPDARAAEVAAKVALILGSADGLAWIDARRDVAGLLIMEDGTVLKSRHLADYEWKG